MNREDLYLRSSLGYNYEELDMLLLNVKSYAEKLLGFLKISTVSGELAIVTFDIIRSDMNNINTIATREQSDPPAYTVTLDTGLIYHLLFASESIIDTPNHRISFDLGKSTVNSGELKNNSKQTIISAFWLSTSFVILHEFAHIYLGHLDYLHDDGQFELDKIRNTIACEADADRQAGQWLAEFFDLSIQESLCYEKIFFPSRVYAYEFYIYVFASLFRIIQDLNQEDDKTHPKSKQRLITVFGGLSMYLEKTLGAEYSDIIIHLTAALLNIEKPFNPENCKNDILKLHHDLYEFMRFDKHIAKTKINKYKYKYKLEQWN